MEQLQALLKDRMQIVRSEIFGVDAQVTTREYINPTKSEVLTSFLTMALVQDKADAYQKSSGGRL